MFDKRLMKVIKGEKKYILLMVVNGFLSALFTFITALCIANIVDALFFKGASISEKLVEFLVLALLIPMKILWNYLFHGYFKRFANLKKNQILLEAIAQLLKSGPIATKESASGGIVTALTEAADQVEPFFGEYLPQFFSLVVAVPLLLILGLKLDILSGFIMLITAPLLPFFLALIGIQSKEANQKRLHSLTNLGNRMLDFLSGIKTLKLYDGLEGYRRQIAHDSEEFRVTTMSVLKVAFMSAFVLEFAATLSTAMIAVSLGLRLMHGEIPFYNSFFVLLITPDYYMAIRKFGAKFHTAMGAKSGADKLFYYKNNSGTEDMNIDLDNFKKEKIGEKVLESDCIHISLENVSYQYDASDKNAVNEIFMELVPGKVTAMVGKSGSGKSTLAYLLMGHIKGQGKIRFNEKSLDKLEVKEVRKHISYIPQKPYIFQDTLRNNLLFVKEDATDAELFNALEKASLSKFLESLPKGLDSVLSEIGTNISVGEAQRIAFARAYLKDCPVLILDESTSALDSENEVVLRKVFEELAEKKTVFVIAHRLDTVISADLIYVLEEGSIIESGSHKKLVEKKGAYRNLVEAWGRLE